MDLIESKFEGETEYPVRELSCSSNAMPFVGKKFEKFEAFALAPLAEIYELDKAKHAFKEVNFLQSAIFWNDGDSMRVEPLPRMAQTVPGFGVETFDYDCDGDGRRERWLKLMAASFLNPARSLSMSRTGRWNRNAPY